MKIAILGATGFVGQRLVQQLLENPSFEILAFSGVDRTSNHKNLRWLKVDLFDFNQIQNSLVGIDCLIYLLHSMVPTAALDKGNFEDFDLYLADNVMRACQAKQVKKVIYLGGIQNVKTDGQSSMHLQSRKEVEDVMFASGVRSMILRAGLIIGSGGSSYLILKNLIHRLPILICPKWCLNKMSPVYLEDVVRGILKIVQIENFESKIYDLSGGSVHTYKELMMILAQEFKLKRIFLDLPLNLTAFSKLWVRLFSGVNKEVVYPLVDSLESDMSPDPKKILALDPPSLSFVESLRTLIPMDQVRKYSVFKPKVQSARCIERHQMKTEQSISEISVQYLNWLPKFLFPWIKVFVQQNLVEFCFLSKKIKLLRLQYDLFSSNEFSQVFNVVGGMLSKPNSKSKLEFRKILGSQVLISVVHDFEPRLPWFVYKFIQAPIHRWIMIQFGKRL